MRLVRRIEKLEQQAAPKPLREGECACVPWEMVMVRAGEPVPRPVRRDHCGLERSLYIVREVLGPTRTVEIGEGPAAKVIGAGAWEDL